MLAVIAKIKVKDGKADDMVQLIKNIIPAVQQEEGTLYYTVNKDRTDPNLVVVVEKYKDDAAFGVHSSSTHLAELFGKAQALVEGEMELMMMDEIASI